MLQIEKLVKRACISKWRTPNESCNYVVVTRLIQTGPQYKEAGLVDGVQMKRLTKEWDTSGAHASENVQKKRLLANAAYDLSTVINPFLTELLQHGCYRF